MENLETPLKTWGLILTPPSKAAKPHQIQRCRFAEPLTDVKSVQKLMQSVDMKQMGA